MDELDRLAGELRRIIEDTYADDALRDLWLHVLEQEVERVRRGGCEALSPASYPPNH